MVSRAVIIVAGGSGSRMNADLPKQFIPLSGLPMLMHTTRAFHTFDPEILIIVALPEKHKGQWKDLCGKYDFRIAHQIADGGETRFHSVKNSLAMVPDDFLVAIHDGARPLVSGETIRRTFAEAGKKGNAVPVIPVSESLRKVEGGNNAAVPRDQFRIIQTPQVFMAGQIKQAYEAAKRNDFTDDASVLEASGETLHLVEGNPENIKITYPHDLIFAEAVIAGLSPTD